jgi:septal ring factor EnvC (AmiA/AmiB activator)
MSKRLENFIRENKKDLNIFEPPADLWNKIEHELQDKSNAPVKKERVIKVSFLLKVAATVVVILSVTVLFWHFRYSQTLISSIDPELAKQQVYYASLIESKQTELKQMEKEEPELYRTFSSELKKMEMSYQQLKKELPESPNQERTVKAMIKNLEIQIRVLNQQLIIIQQINDLKKEGKGNEQAI